MSGLLALILIHKKLTLLILDFVKVPTYYVDIIF